MGKLKKLYDSEDTSGFKGDKRPLKKPPRPCIHTITEYEDTPISVMPPKTAPLSPDQMGDILSFGIRNRIHLQIAYQMQSTKSDKLRHLQFNLAEPKSGTQTLWVCNPENGHVSGSGWDGKHITRQLMGNRLALYKALGCHEIKILCGTIGTYAWARYGYLPGQLDWNMIREQLRGDIPSLSEKFNLAAETRITLEEIAADSDPRALWRLADMPETAGNKKLAFHILREELNVMWHGRFNMKNPEQMARIRAYIGEDVFDASMENARRVMGQTENLAPATPAQSLLSPE